MDEYVHMHNKYIKLQRKKKKGFISDRSELRSTDLLKVGNFL